MSYSRRARIDDKMSREEQEDLALHNANKGMSLNSIAELLDLTVYMVEKYIHRAEKRAFESTHKIEYINDHKKKA